MLVERRVACQHRLLMHTYHQYLVATLLSVAFSVLLIWPTSAYQTPDASSPTAAAGFHRYKGVNLFPFSSDVLASNEVAVEELDEIKALGANWVVINFLIEQDNRSSNEVYATNHTTPTPAALTTFIRAAHARGLAVFLKPVVVCRVGGCTMINIAPSNTTRWFESYANYIESLAIFAAGERVEALAVGLELMQLSGDSFTSHWQSVIARVRKVYPAPGLLTYCSVFYPIETQQVKFWSSLDFIAMDTYVPFITNASTDPMPTQQLMLARFTKYLAYLDEWHRAQPDGVSELPLIFTEVGYPSSPNGMAYPASDAVEGCPKDTIYESNFTLQQMAFEALFTALSTPEGLKAVDGVVIFWFDNPSGPDFYLGNHTTNSWACSWTPRGKPAECTIAQAFGGTCPKHGR